jgi:hypothetical protein
MESTNSARQPDTSLDRWLTRKGFRANPFQRWNAEHDQDLPNYFVDIGGFDELLHLAEPCVIFAPRGCGKTAQRQMLASQCRPFKRDSPWLDIAYTYGGFERALDSAGGEIQQLRPIHHVSALCHLGLIALVDEASRDSRIQNALADPGIAPRLAAYVARFAPHLADAPIAEPSSVLDGLGSLELLQGFSLLVKDAGLESCVVLVDGVDEFPPTANDPTQAVALLAPLLGTLSLIECPGLIFRFLLPQELESALRACGWFRADRLHMSRIAWKESNLFLAVIRQRLIHFSRREPPYEDLAQLCRDELAQVINEEITTLAGGSPRAVLILANRLLQSHCQQPDPPELIALETWRQVESMWLARRDDFVAEESHVTAMDVRPRVARFADYPILCVEEEKHIVRLGKYDITSKIPPQDYRVLVCLYRHQDKVCIKDLLVEEAWPKAEKQGVTDQAIAASIARLRRVFREYHQDAEYIQTIRGHGYRLYPDGTKDDPGPNC